MRINWKLAWIAATAAIGGPPCRALAQLGPVVWGNPSAPSLANTDGRAGQTSGQDYLTPTHFTLTAWKVELTQATSFAGFTMNGSVHQSPFFGAGSFLLNVYEPVDGILTEGFRLDPLHGNLVDRAPISPVGSVIPTGGSDFQGYTQRIWMGAYEPFTLGPGSYLFSLFNVSDVPLTITDSALDYTSAWSASDGAPGSITLLDGRLRTGTPAITLHGPIPSPSAFALLGIALAIAPRRR